MQHSRGPVVPNRDRVRAVTVFLALVLSACGTPSPMAPNAPSDSRRPARFLIASALHQVGLVGGMTPEPFAVKVVDASGTPLPGVAVVWEATDGQSTLCFNLPLQCHLGRWPVPSGGDGVSRVWVRPTKLGKGTITAGVEGLQAPPIAFSVDGIGLVIRFGPVFDCMGTIDPVHFWDLFNSSLLRVSVGTPVEWEWGSGAHSSCVARIVSTSAPIGGASFDSGDLTPGQRFRFTPTVPGIWQFQDLVSGGTGQLTVLPTTVSAPTALAPLSPPHRAGMAGAPLPQPFIVRATDAEGRSVPGAVVEWEVADGQGAICITALGECTADGRAVVTGGDGTSRIWYHPYLVGPGALTARVKGLAASTVAFTLDARAVLIPFGPLHDCTGPSDPALFVIPGGGNTVVVARGTPVAWIFPDNYHPACRARIAFTALPSGGAAFDSGWLSPGMRFEFTPPGVGTWHLVETLSGGSSLLTVVAASGPP